MCKQHSSLVSRWVAKLVMCCGAGEACIAGVVLATLLLDAATGGHGQAVAAAATAAIGCAISRPAGGVALDAVGAGHAETVAPTRG